MASASSNRWPSASITRQAVPAWPLVPVRAAVCMGGCSPLARLAGLYQSARAPNLGAWGRITGGQGLPADLAGNAAHGAAGRANIAPSKWAGGPTWRAARVGSGRTAVVVRGGAVV